MQTVLPSADLFRPRSGPESLPITLTLDDLYGLFPPAADRPRSEPLAADAVPEPYRQLLVHNHHMTVTVEKFYGDAVNVKVMEVRRVGNVYARKILLTLKGTGRVVQFGIVSIDLSKLAPQVADEIVSERTPLGRVLIQHNVLRTVRPVSFFRADPCPKMCQWFGLTQPETVYGRLGVIYTDHEPAIKVAEILTPVSRGPVTE